EEFADALSMADEVLLLPIYPARELPIEGVESEMIGRLVRAPWRIVEKNALAEELAHVGGGVIVTFGAGDIDRECDKIATILGKE
ncbi:MAG: UDP-N-acetylmuramate--L-alanine ligase, partial [Tidjanibacter sp.]|nr:UDP-N-acetylmuramate--L-alanine ligase [Tidjanibacter sp.]